MPAKKRGGATLTERHGAGLTEHAVESHVGERSLRLGKVYLADEAIFRARREGDLLKAHCRGQSADHYVLSARVQGGKIVAANCDCPVGEGGHCKHVAAMLLCAVRSPHEFEPADSLQKRLGECTKEKLIELVVQLLEHDSDLESWLELALPAATATPAKVSSKPFRKQVASAFASAGYGWEADRQLTSTLRSVRAIGDRFATQKNHAAAVAVFVGLIEAFVSEYETFQDETGNIVAEANESAAALGKCLAKLLEGSEARQAALAGLFRLLKYDIEFGGIGLADNIPEIFEKQATAVERAIIAKWIREQPLDSKESSSQWRRQNWGSVLLAVGGELEDDASYLNHCREFGLGHAVVARLLERGRIDEAMQEIRTASDYDAMQHADQLLAHKFADLAHEVVKGRLLAKDKSRNDWQLREWLKRFYQMQKDWPNLLELEIASFADQPTLATYQAVREVARKLRIWDDLREKLIAKVPPRAANELVRIHLDEDEVELAIGLLESQPQNRFAWGWDPIDLQVAKQAEKNYPEAALKIYQAAVERMIGARGRDHYREACRLLKKIRQLFRALDRRDYWDDYRQQLLHQHRSLRALQEEVALAKL